jgi:hypothetical protein|tara:strand:+ start:357 stop:581 length:225 start_codon:yes stop_codon:yes gene_type:complete
MSKISKEGFEQITIIRNALDAMYDKLDKVVYVKRKPTKDVDVNYIETNIFESVKTEFDAIAGIVELTRTWEETK